jgi:CHAT domain/NACHT domain
MDYLDFELRIGAKAAGGYPVAVVRSPAGEVSTNMQFQAVEPELHNRILTLEKARSAADESSRSATADRALHFKGKVERSADITKTAEELGRELFDLLLTSDIRSCYRRSLDRAREQGKGLRLRLRIEAPELAAVPWEYLYDESEGDYICLLSETPLIRYVELSRPQQPLTIAPPLHILGLVASPSDLLALDVAREKEQMAAAIEHLTDAGYMTLTWLEGQTWRDLQTAIRQGPWHVFHFIGHGGFDAESGEGLIVLADESGQTHRLAATQLGRLLAGHQSMRLAILNACEGARASKTNLMSSVGTVLTQRGIPAVVSMQYEITDWAALEFSRTFYDTLAGGMPVDAAVTEARKSISIALDNTVEWGTPVLHMRSPDGLLFKIDVASAIFQKTPPAPVSAPIAAPAAASATATAPGPANDEVRRGLLILLNKVKQFWVNGVLEKSLYRAALLDLGMEFMQEAVDNPWGSVLETPGADSRSLPPEQKISDVFQEQGGSLLILGEPGSGKTTTMLGLARDLIALAENDVSRPIPVVFNLSAWTDPNQKLLDWLNNELSAKYQIPKKIGSVWLEQSRLLPLLDGLDEVSAERRSACVEAINAFTLEAGLVGVVVCCRLKEYIALPTRLTLNGAIRLQPLSREQVQKYIADAGEKLAALQAVLQKDSDLQIQARSPLMLNLMVRAYQDLAVEDLAREGLQSAEARRKHLFDTYIARMFRRAAQGGGHA